MRRTGISWALGCLVLCALGCGDSFEEGRAKPQGTSGLLVIDLKDGTGDPIKDGDRVQVHYRGWVKSTQKKFDDSHEKGTPLTVAVGEHQVIPGFEEGLRGMKAGGERRLFIPSQLGYGEKGAGRDIPPNADLVFQVEVVKVLEPLTDVKVTVLKDGTGPGIKVGDQATVHYTGTLTNGTKFDSSHDHGEPFTLTVGVGQVIKGWDIGLIGAKKGSQLRLDIPSHLGYGAQGSPPKIPPDAPLVFEIEVVDIKPGR